MDKRTEQVITPTGRVNERDIMAAQLKLNGATKWILVVVAILGMLIGGITYANYIRKDVDTNIRDIATAKQIANNANKKAHKNEAEIKIFEVEVRTKLDYLIEGQNKLAKTQEKIIEKLEKHDR